MLRRVVCRARFFLLATFLCAPTYGKKRDEDTPPRSKSCGKFILSIYDPVQRAPNRWLSGPLTPEEVKDFSRKKRFLKWDDYEDKWSFNFSLAMKEAAQQTLSLKRNGNFTSYPLGRFRASAFEQHLMAFRRRNQQSTRTDLSPDERAWNFIYKDIPIAKDKENTPRHSHLFIGEKGYYFRFENESGRVFYGKQEDWVQDLGKKKQPPTLFLISNDNQAIAEKEILPE